MIADLFINIWTWILDHTIGALPEFTGYPEDLTDAISWFNDKVHSLSCLFPLDTLWDVMRLMFLGLVAFFVFRATAWVFHWNQPTT